MEEIEAKISAIDSKQYYTLNPYERLQDGDQVSQGSEDFDVEMIKHRYDSPHSSSVTKTKSLAEEILEEKEKNTRPEPPPDLLVSSNLR